MVCCCRYKILFLDVLFPLSVDKIIFVDADQVGRKSAGMRPCQMVMYIHCCTFMSSFRYKYGLLTTCCDIV